MNSFSACALFLVASWPTTTVAQCSIIREQLATILVTNLDTGAVACIPDSIVESGVGEDLDKNDIPDESLWVEVGSRTDEIRITFNFTILHTFHEFQIVGAISESSAQDGSVSSNFNQYRYREFGSTTQIVTVSTDPDDAEDVQVTKSQVESLWETHDWWRLMYNTGNGLEYADTNYLEVELDGWEYITYIRMDTNAYPSKSPTSMPTQGPTKRPSEEPSKAPTDDPTFSPTNLPSQAPTPGPLQNPTDAPSMSPSLTPSAAPSQPPTSSPSMIPTSEPTKMPSKAPSDRPTRIPTSEPTEAPTHAPTDLPTHSPLADAILSQGSLVIDTTVDYSGQSTFASDIKQGLVNASITAVPAIESVVDMSVEIDSIESSVISSDGAATQAIETVVSLAFGYPDENTREIYEATTTQEDVNTHLELYLQRNWLDESLTTTLSIDKTADDALASQTSTQTTESLAVFEFVYLYAAGSLLVVILMAVGASFIMSKRQSSANTNLRLNGLPVFGIYALDFISDVCFVLQVYITSESVTDTVVLALGIVFIVGPMVLNIWQLLSAIKSWTANGNHQACIKPWLIQHVSLLYATAFFSGSSFAAVALFNCCLFGMNVFNMGLSLRNQAIFTNKRLFTVVLCENIPQMILQCIYSINANSFTLITAVSLTFSLLSITLSIFSFFAHRYIIQLDDVSHVKLSLISKHVASFSKHEFIRKQMLTASISAYLAKSLALDQRLVDLIKPIQTQHGTTLLFQVLTGRAEYTMVSNSSFDPAASAVASTVNRDNKDDEFAKERRNKLDRIVHTVGHEIESKQLGKEIKRVWQLEHVPELTLVSVTIEGKRSENDDHATELATYLGTGSNAKSDQTDAASAAVATASAALEWAQPTAHVTKQGSIIIVESPKADGGVEVLHLEGAHAQHSEGLYAGYGEEGVVNATGSGGTNDTTRW